MVYWRGIMQMVLGAVHGLFLLSLVITWMFYPAQPIYDLETDQIIGY